MCPVSAHLLFVRLQKFPTCCDKMLTLRLGMLHCHVISTLLYAFRSLNTKANILKISWLLTLKPLTCLLYGYKRILRIPWIESVKWKSFEKWKINQKHIKKQTKIIIYLLTYWHIMYHLHLIPPGQ